MTRRARKTTRPPNGAHSDRADYYRALGADLGLQHAAARAAMFDLQRRRRLAQAGLRRALQMKGTV
jgi:hypothetical protein